MGLPAFRGGRLAEARRAAGLTQAQLAAAVGVSAPERVAQWERGAEQPRPRFVPVLAEVLGLQALELLDVDPADPPLPALRIAAGLSLTDVKTATALSVMTYQRLESGVGVSDPGESAVLAVAGALGIGADRVRAAIRRSRAGRA